MSEGANRLQQIVKHPNYYVSGLGVIYYKRGALKFSCKTKSITQARRFVEEELAKRAGLTPKELNAKTRGITNPSVSSIWAELLIGQSVGKDEATIKNYNKSWKHGLSGYWASKNASDLTTEGVERFKLWYLKEKPKRDFKQTHVHLNMLARYAFKKGFIKLPIDMSVIRDLSGITEKLAQRQKVGRVATVSEQIKLLGAWAYIQETKSQKSDLNKTYELGMRARIGVYMGLLCGMRIKEVLRSKWSNIDFKNKKMNVWSFKNHKWREVPIPDRLFDALKEWKKKAPKESEWVFHMPSDLVRPISTQVFERVWSSVREVAEIEGTFRFHDLRHTFASMTAEQGWPPKVACDILDMSLKIYDKVYAKPGLGSKTTLINNLFGATENEKLGNGIVRLSCDQRDNQK